jgi:hypothetical protein
MIRPDQPSESSTVRYTALARSCILSDAARGNTLFSCLPNEKHDGAKQETKEHDLELPSELTSVSNRMLLIIPFGDMQWPMPDVPDHKLQPTYGEDHDNH